MKKLTSSQRQELLTELLTQVDNGEITEGHLLRELRKNLLGMNQEQYAKLVNISRRTLSDIEKSSGNHTINLINKAFRPLGLSFSLNRIDF